MTRWKREQTYTLRSMLPHHQYSRWHDYVLRSAESLGLPLGYRERHYTSIGGELVWEREWYTSAPALERPGVGGIAGVHLRAEVLLQEDDSFAMQDRRAWGHSDAAW